MSSFYCSQNNSHSSVWVFFPARRNTIYQTVTQHSIWFTGETSLRKRNWQYLPFLGDAVRSPLGVCKYADKSSLSDTEGKEQTKQWGAFQLHMSARQTQQILFAPSDLLHIIYKIYVLPLPVLWCFILGWSSPHCL